MILLGLGIGAASLNAFCPLDPWIQCVSKCDDFWDWCVEGSINEYCVSIYDGENCTSSTGHECCRWIAGL